MGDFKLAPKLESAPAMLLAVLEAERLLHAGAIASFAVTTAARKHYVDPAALAFAVLQKVVAVQRARAALALDAEGEGA